MSWFRKRRLKVEPSELARLLHGILAIEEYSPLLPGNFNVPTYALERYQSKLVLYRESTVLLALLQESSLDQVLEKTLHNYETILFGTDPHSCIESGRLVSVKVAMKDKSELIQHRGDDPYLSWGRRWFADLGWDVSNPITLAMFLLVWTGFYIAARKSIAEQLPT